MIEIVKQRIWTLLKNHEISLVMLYDNDGEILWYRGRNLNTRSVYHGDGFLKDFIMENLSDASCKNRCIVIKDNINQSCDVDKKIVIKSLLIQPINDKLFLYVDSGIKKNFTNTDWISFVLLGQLLGDIVELIRCDEENKSICGESESVGNIRELVLKYALEDEPILLTGETGVGKTHTAELIHNYSGRKGKFVVAEIPSLNENVFESEMFGHKKGSFTSAYMDRSGLVHEAEGGTLFIDEISEIPLTFQTKLLRFIDTHKYRTIGDSKEHTANVRIVAASNRDLIVAMREKSFRQDLYFRLNVLEINIPPLRERTEDIESLIQQNKKYLKGKKITRKGFDELKRYQWPGNVRELINVLKRLGIHGKNLMGDTCIKEYIYKKNIFGDIYTQKLKSEHEIYVNDIWGELQAGKDFWDAVKTPYLKRELNRKQVKSIIKKALSLSGGKYKDCIYHLNIDEGSYKKFLNFLNDNNLN